MLMEGRMTKAADVYSFGMLMWELYTGKKLFDGLRQSQVLFVSLTNSVSILLKDRHICYCSCASSTCTEKTDSHGLKSPHVP